jgi:outer membrane lipoprotein-sorting protein
MTGNLPTPQGDFPITIYSKRPNKSKSELDIMGNQMIPSAFDGETAWMLNPMMGSTTPQKLSDEQTRLVADQAQFDPLYMNYGDKGYTITLDGTEDVNGKSCFKLKVEKMGGDPQYHFLDAETYMLVKLNAKAADGSRADTFFSDYKKTDFGIMMPFTWEISTQMGPQQIVFTKITANEPIDDKEFAFPGG